MKVPRRQMMNHRLEFLHTKTKGTSKVGRHMILSTLPSEELTHSKFAFITSKKVGKAYKRNFVRRRFRDLIARHGDNIQGSRYIVMIGRYNTAGADFAELEKEFLRLGTKLGIF